MRWTAQGATHRKGLTPTQAKDKFLTNEAELEWIEKLCHPSSPYCGFTTCIARQGIQRWLNAAEVARTGHASQFATERRCGKPG